jgi:hypothetical protein
LHGVTDASIRFDSAAGRGGSWWPARRPGQRAGLRARASNLVDFRVVRRGRASTPRERVRGFIVWSAVAWLCMLACEVARMVYGQDETSPATAGRRCNVTLAAKALVAAIALIAGACGSKDEKPAEAKPAETKPAEAKPETEAKAPGKSIWQPKNDGCIRLGWSGGSAGTGFKFVDATVVAETPENLVITYEQKNGSFKADKVSADELRGTWAQKGSTGTFYLKYDPATETATGWWRTDGADNRDTLTFEKKCN